MQKNPSLLMVAERKSQVLSQPSLPCLSRFHTISLTAGCPYACRYCYARSFRSNPGPGKVLFYANTYELLCNQLPRKRKKPELVYFSTACEPFAPFPQVLETLYRVMKLLLEHNVSLLISTKSNPPKQFLGLFARFPGKVHVQVGLTTLDDHVRSVLESRANTVAERLHALRALVERGISIEVRSDPLIPDLTDNEESFDAPYTELSRCGITRAAASYLLLRPGNAAAMDVSIAGWRFSEMAARIYTQEVSKYCGNNTIRIPGTAYRQQKLERLKQIAASHGIQLQLCGCKNPDITTDCCHPLPPVKKRMQQGSFFE